VMADKPMTADEVRALLALAEKATPGPWEKHGPNEYHRCAVVAETDDGFGAHVALCDKVPSSDRYYEANAAFIAAAREALPAALDALDAAERERDRRGAVLRQLFDAVTDGDMVDLAAVVDDIDDDPAIAAGGGEGGRHRPVDPRGDRDE